MQAWMRDASAVTRINESVVKIGKERGATEGSERNPEQEVDDARNESGPTPHRREGQLYLQGSPLFTLRLSFGKLNLSCDVIVVNHCYHHVIVFE